MAGDALRVLGVAYNHATSINAALTERFVWVGLVRMTDPLRPGMNELVRVFGRAGIRAVMITGDQSTAAHAVGKQLSLNTVGRWRSLTRSISTGLSTTLWPVWRKQPTSSPE